jgi:hypothetical protein
MVTLSLQAFKCDRLIAKSDPLSWRGEKRNSSLSNGKRRNHKFDSESIIHVVLYKCISVYGIHLLSRVAAAVDNEEPKDGRKTYRC